MTDIVKRLREGDLGYNNEAADEIERLREELAQHKDLTDKLATMVDELLYDGTKPNYEQVPCSPWCLNTVNALDAFKHKLISREKNDD